MMFMLKINANDKLFENYRIMLRNKFWKLLPMLDSKNSTIGTYVDSLLFEMEDMGYAFIGLEYCGIYITLVSKLGKIHKELTEMNSFDQLDVKRIKREIRNCTNLIENAR